MALANTIVPFLFNTMPIVNLQTGTPSVAFLQFWQVFSNALNAELGALETATASEAAAASAIAQAVQAAGSATSAYTLASSAYTLANSAYTLAYIPVTNVASLPSPTLGARGFVTDSTSSTFYAHPVAGGGTNVTPVFANSTTWFVG